MRCCLAFSIDTNHFLKSPLKRAFFMVLAVRLKIEAIERSQAPQEFPMSLNAAGYVQG